MAMLNNRYHRKTEFQIQSHTQIEISDFDATLISTNVDLTDKHWDNQRCCKNKVDLRNEPEF